MLVLNLINYQLGKKSKNVFFEVEANKNKNPPLGIYYPRFDSTFSKLTTNIFR